MNDVKTLPEIAGTGSRLYWNHESHYVGDANGTVSEEIYFFQDGSEALASLVVAEARDGRWVCNICGDDLAGRDVCPCRFPQHDDRPF